MMNRECEYFYMYLYLEINMNMSQKTVRAVPCCYGDKHFTSQPLLASAAIIPFLSLAILLIFKFISAVVLVKYEGA